MFAMSWDWLLTKNDKQLIAQAREQEHAEIERTVQFIKRLNQIEPETIVSEIQKMLQEANDGT